MGSSRKVITGYKYHGGLAQLICVGPVTTLKGIWNGDTQIYEGPISSSSADSDGKTILQTDLGEIRFYWGLETQVVDATLEGLMIDYGDGTPVGVSVPNWKRFCYVVSDRLEFGQQTAPPTLHFEVTRAPGALSITSHLIGEDAVAPEIVYEALTDSFWGLGISAGYIDTASFVAAAETVITEGLGISPSIDDNTTVRELIGKLLSYIDGAIYWEAGKIRIKLFRAESTAGVEAIDEAVLLDEPTPDNGGVDETWSLTRLTFTDRDNKYEQAVESYTDDANAAILGENVPKEFSLPWIRQRSVAKKIVKRIGIKGGLIPVSYTLRCKSTVSDLVPGSRALLSYSKLGIEDVLVRVTRRVIGGPEDRTIQLTVVEEQTRDDSNDYVPASDTFTVPSKVFSDGMATATLLEVTPRLGWLPSGLLDGQPDGFLVAAARADSAAEYSKLWFTFDSALLAYTRIAGTVGFPCKGQIIGWHQARGGSSWIVRVQMDSERDYDYLAALITSNQEFTAVTARRLVKTVGTPKSQHRMETYWFTREANRYAFTVDASIIDIELTPEAYGSIAPGLETLSGDSECLCSHIYFGRVDTFLKWKGSAWQFERSGPNYPINPGTGLSADTDLIRVVKVTAGGSENEQAVSDVTATTFDRDDTTMCPDGTLSREWGPRALTTHEQLDFAAGAEVDGATHPNYTAVDEFDEALLNVCEGDNSDDEYLLTQGIDDTLGAMVDLGFNHYGLE